MKYVTRFHMNQKTLRVLMLFTTIFLAIAFGPKPQKIKAYDNPAFRIIDNVLVEYNDDELMEEGIAPTKVIIPDGVTSIGETAFYGNGLIEEVVIPNSVTSIGFSAFQNCVSLVKINIPDSVTSIGSAAFMGCKNLTEITIPKSVTHIDSSAFATCFKLKKINLPKTITDIGRSAFQDTPWFEKLPKKNGMVILNGVLLDGTTCKGKVTVPNDVKYIAEGAFFSNYDITSITLSKNLKEIGDEAFYRCGEIKSIDIPKGVTSIGDSAFAYCDNLSKINIPSSVKSIGGLAFYNTPWLEAKTKKNPMVIVNNIVIYGWDCTGDIVIPNKVTAIADYAFKFSKITNVKIPNTVKSIGFSAFDGCKKLKNVNIPSSVTSIGSRAFESCTSLENFTIPKTVKSLGDRVFADCKSLKTVNINCKLTSIKEFTFYGCTNLTKVNIPNTVERIERYAFYNCSKLKNISIPKKVTFLGAHPFDNSAWQNSMKGSLVIVNNILVANLSSKKNVKIPDNVIKIAEEAFAKNNKIENVYIPDSVTEIGSLAFYYCSNLKKVYRSKAERNTGYGIFTGCPNKVSVIYVAIDNKTDIINKGGWFPFTAYVNGSDEHASWKVSDKSVATIVQDEDMGSFQAKTLGTVTVTASIKTPFGVLEDSVEVTVVDNDILLFRGPTEVTVGKTYEISVRDIYEDADVKWSISDSSMAKIEYSFGNYIRIKTLKPGKVTLYADMDGAHGELEITIAK